jgi:hypothetical protein
MKVAAEIFRKVEAHLFQSAGVKRQTAGVGLDQSPRRLT